MTFKMYHAIIVGLCCLALCISAAAEDPSITFGTSGQFPAGTTVFVNGTTNLAPGDHLAVEVYSSSFGPTPKTGNGTFYGASGIVTVQPGQGGANLWSFPVNTTGFPPDVYVVTVTGIEVQVTASTTFTLVPALTMTVSIPPTPTPTTPQVTVSTTIPTTSPPTTTTPGFGGITGSAGILIAFALIYGKNR